MPDTKMLIGLGVAGGGALMAYESGMFTGGEKEKKDPATIMSSPTAGGSPGLGAVSSGTKKEASGGTDITVEAPEIQESPAVMTSGDSGGGTKKDTTTDSGSSGGSSSSGSISNFEPSEETKKQVENTPTATSDSSMKKKVEAPGVQSEDPDEATMELDRQQGDTRTIHDSERENQPELDLGGNSSKKEKTSSEDSGDSGEGLLDKWASGDWF